MRFPLSKRASPPLHRAPRQLRTVLALEQQAVDALVNAFEELGLILDDQPIQDAIEEGDLSTLLDVFDLLEWERHEQQLRLEMTPRVTQVIAKEGARAFNEVRLMNAATGGRGTSPPALPPTAFSDPPPSPGPRAKLYGTLRFDVTNPYAIMHAERFAADLVREVTRSTRAAIREAVVDSFRNGFTADQLARRLRTTIGLTTRQARSVQSYRERLEAREILSGPQVEVLVRRYFRKVRNRRAETIARTEILRASNEGRLQGWRSAADVGWLDVNASVKEWVSTADGPSFDPSKPSTCEVCSAMDEVKVMGIEGEFTLGSGRKVQSPPAHPNCRCTVIIHPPDPPEDFDSDYSFARVPNVLPSDS